MAWAVVCYNGVLPTILDSSVDEVDEQLMQLVSITQLNTGQRFTVPHLELDL